MEEVSLEKHEHYKGEIFLMPSSTLNHSLVKSNAVAVLGNKLAKRPCRVYDSDAQIYIAKSGLYTYPDASVVCGKNEVSPAFKNAITNPVLLAEVLSKSTKGYDRGDKFIFYRNLDALKEYLLIESEKVHIEYFRRLENNDWLMHDATELSEILSLHELGIDVSVADFYDKVEFDSVQEMTP
jgi:Uma2 family endonuclease